MSFDFGFYKLSEKLLFVVFQQGEQGFWVFNRYIGIPSQKSESHEPP